MLRVIRSSRHTDRHKPLRHIRSRRQDLIINRSSKMHPEQVPDNTITKRVCHSTIPEVHIPAQVPDSTISVRVLRILWVQSSSLLNRLLFLTDTTASVSIPVYIISRRVAQVTAIFRSSIQILVILHSLIRQCPQVSRTLLILRSMAQVPLCIISKDLYSPVILLPIVRMRYSPV